VHERYRQTTDRRQTDGRRHIANMNMSSRSLISHDQLLIYLLIYLFDVKVNQLVCC